MLTWFILTILISCLGLGWFGYDMVTNFWDYYKEAPVFIQILGPLVFLGSLSGGLKQYE